MKNTDNSFYSLDELKSIGFKSFGENVQISRKASIYSPTEITIGDNVRIDDFCILSGRITIENYIHIAAYSALYGGESGITIGDFANISSRVTIYAISDDYSGETMTNPMIPDRYKNLDNRPVHIGRHVIIGSSSIVLPGTNIADGGAFGCFSLVKQDTEGWSMYAGIPVHKIKPRSNALLQLQKEMEDSMKKNILAESKRGGVSNNYSQYGKVYKKLLGCLDSALSMMAFSDYAVACFIYGKGRCAA